MNIRGIFIVIWSMVQLSRELLCWRLWVLVIARLNGVVLGAIGGLLGVANAGI